MSKGGIYKQILSGLVMFLRVITYLCYDVTNVKGIIVPWNHSPAAIETYTEYYMRETAEAGPDYDYDRGHLPCLLSIIDDLSNREGSNQQLGQSGHDTIQRVICLRLNLLLFLCQMLSQHIYIPAYTIRFLS